MPSDSAPQVATFDQWAEVYDVGANPLLSLEEQTLPPLLPAITGMHVLDIGCGTGRWLVRLEALRPASLTGIDCSAVMLDRARSKLSGTPVLLRSDARTLAVPDASQHLILCSFVLGYLDDPAGFAAECARALKPGGYLLLSDMHPQTARQRGWTRSFTTAGKTIHIAARVQPLSDTVALFRHHGFELCHLGEPAFDSAQRGVFEEANRLEDFLALAGVPAIYLLKLRKPLTSRRRSGAGPVAALQLKNAPWSTSASKWNEEPLCIDDGYVLASRTSPSLTSESIDLAGYILLSGLINAHDHLEFALFPRLGRTPDGPAYGSAAEWAGEIHQRHATTIAHHSQVPLETRLWWGAIRNVLSGVTTVCHHNPLHPELFHPDFPVRVLSRFGWGHSLTFEPTLAERYRATPADQPFVLHAAEGTDLSSSIELAQLDRMGLLDRRTVIVHGLALTSDDVALLNRRGSALVLCPTSNRYLFGKAPSNAFIHSIGRAALGSDSPLTSAGDLLDDIHQLRVEQELDAGSIYDLATTNAAEIFQLRQGEGHILPGGRADLIAVQHTGATPAETLASLNLAQLELVLLAGRVQLASPALYVRLSDDLRDGLHLLDADGIPRWIRAPLPSLFRSAERALGSGGLRLGRKRVRHLRSH